MTCDRVELALEIFDMSLFTLAEGSLTVEKHQRLAQRLGREDPGAHTPLDFVLSFGSGQA